MEGNGASGGSGRAPRWVRLSASPGTPIPATGPGEPILSEARSGAEATPRPPQEGMIPFAGGVGGDGDVELKGGVAGSFKSEVRSQELKLLLQTHATGSTQIKTLEFLNETLDGYPPKDANLVLVLIEERLLGETVRTLVHQDLAERAYMQQQYHSGESMLEDWTLWHDKVPAPSGQPWPLDQFRADLAQTACDFHELEQHTVKSPPLYWPSLIRARVYGHDEADTTHQDGRTVLALRSFFQDVEQHYPNLRGVIFVGAFPEALLVRDFGRADWDKGSYYEQVATEILAYRSDIVLADLHGSWDDRYNQGARLLPIDENGRFSANAGHPPPPIPWPAPASQAGSSKGCSTIEDFFWLIDVELEGHGVNVGGQFVGPDKEVSKHDRKGRGGWDKAAQKLVTPYELLDHRLKKPMPHARTLLFFGEYRDAEEGLLVRRPDVNKPGYWVWDEGKEKGTEYPITKKVGLISEHGRAVWADGEVAIRNPIAVPDILVSRINAQHVAWVPYQSPVPPVVYLRDPFLERQLLIAYLHRNSEYRNGQGSSNRQCSGLAHPNPDEGYWNGVDLSMALSSYWNEKPQPLEPPKSWRSTSWKKPRFKVGIKGKPVSFQQWLTDPEYAAILRSLEVHGTKDGLNYGVRPPQGREGFQDFWELWDQDMLKDTSPSFFWNISSWGNGVFHAESRAFNDSDRYYNDAYGWGLVADCLLFYCKGLAVLSRAQTEWNHPGREVEDGLKPIGQDQTPQDYRAVFDLTLEEGRTFGETWRAIFELEMNDAVYWEVAKKEDRTTKQARSLFDNTHEQRKNSYRFGVVGDWTLRLNDARHKG